MRLKRVLDSLNECEINNTDDFLCFTYTAAWIVVLFTEVRDRKLEAFERGKRNYRYFFFMILAFEIPNGDVRLKVNKLLGTFRSGQG